VLAVGRARAGETEPAAPALHTTTTAIDKTQQSRRTGIPTPGATSPIPMIYLVSWAGPVCDALN
jgi:hypothetical protein